MNESIYVFNDGSTGSKLLQSELKEFDVKIIDVTQDKHIEQWFSHIKPDNKVYLHLNYEQLSVGKDNHTRDILKGIESKGFKGKIFLPYEGLDKKTMEKRARLAGIGESKIGVKIGEYKATLEGNTLSLGSDFKGFDTTKSENEISNIINTVSEILPNVHELSGNIGKDEEMQPRTATYRWRPPKEVVYTNLKLDEGKDEFEKKSEEFRNQRRRKKV